MRFLKVIPVRMSIRSLYSVECQYPEVCEQVWSTHITICDLRSFLEYLDWTLWAGIFSITVMGREVVKCSHHLALRKLRGDNMQFGMPCLLFAFP